MANRKLTQLTEITTLANDDLIYTVDVSDNTGDVNGTSKKITFTNLATNVNNSLSLAIADISDITITGVTDNEILAYDNTSGEWINQTAAEAGLATATHTHSTSDIDSGTFADARIAESNVTQHQAALSITESQISDLGSYTTASSADTLTNKTIDADNNTISNLHLGNEVTWNLISDVADRTAFTTGDKILIYEAGVGMRKVDFSDLPGAGGGLSNVVEDTTPQLGGDLDLNSNNITGTGNINTTGTITTSGNVNGATPTEIGYLSGVTSAIQTQINGITGVTTEISNVVEDTTPQLGGNLDAQTFNITNVTDLTVTDVQATGSSGVHLKNSGGTALISVGGGGGSNVSILANTNFNDSSILGVDNFDYQSADGTVVALGNLGTTETIDFSAGVYQEGTLDDNVTITHSNEVTGRKITLVLAYDGTAQRTITWSDVDKWAGGSAPDAPSAAGEVLVVTMIYVGTTCYATGELFS